MKMKLMATAVALLPMVGFAQDFEKGKAAAEAGDFAAALKVWTPLAEQGNVDAQYNLGRMYRLGEGGPKDNAEAARWFRLAADQGHSAARYELRILFAPALGTEIVHVRTGCYWESDEMHGSVRLSVTSRGFEIIANYLYFQWIAYERAPDGPVVEIIAQATIPELNDNFYAFGLPEFADTACQKLYLSVSHTYPFALSDNALEDREMDISIGGIGEVTANWR